MIDPPRLLDDGATPIELELLRAGDADEPSFEAQSAMLGALGLGTAVLATTKTATATVATTGARVALAKWWATGAVAAAVAAGGGSYWVFVDNAGSSAPAAVTVPAERPSPVRLVSPTSLPPAAAPDPSVKEAAPERSPRAVGATTRAPSAAASSSTLQEQIALIDRARTAARSGQPAATLAALAEYSKQFPRGELQQEATMLRIEALVARGDKRSAAVLGRRFLAEHPRSALSGRVRQLIGETP